MGIVRGRSPALRSCALLALVAVTIAVAGNWSAADRAAANPLADITTVSAGSLHTCAATSGGEVKCWGVNWYGQLGDGTILDRLAPVNVAGLGSAVADVSAGFDYTCARTTGAGVECWGNNYFGQLGDGTTTNSSTPVNVAGLGSGVAAISGGGYHTCAVTTGGGVKCWGRNDYGQLGDGTSTDSPTPVDVVGLSSGVAAVSAGGYHTCALTTGGGVKCWGGNGQGQLGDGTSTDSSTPVDVVSLSSGVAAVNAGGSHTCAVMTGGGAKCWGKNDLGQLGDGTNTGRSTAVDVVGLSSGVAAVDANVVHTCAVDAGGGVKCWGYNNWGKLGDGTFSSTNTPVDVVGLSSGVAATSGGSGHTCARTSSGGVMCWGLGGVLGDGTDLTSYTPVDVVSSGPKSVADTDGDGCTDQQENGPDPAQGGQRDYFNFWDFFDVPTGAGLTRDRNVTSLDIYQVLGRFNATDIGPGDFDRNSDPLSTPNAQTPGDDRANYHPAYDRGPLVGPNAWDLGPADGAIAAPDIFAVTAQFGHSCA